MSILHRTTYRFEEKLSFLDICKIATHFSKYYEPSYYSFNSERNKNNDYDYHFNLILKNKEGNVKIELDYMSVSFYGIAAKESLIKFEEIVDALRR